MTRASNVPIQGEILNDGASLEGGDENLIGKLQTDKETKRAWGYGVRGERPEFVGNIKNVTVYATTAASAVDGDLLLSNKKYHAGEGYEVQVAVHTTDVSGSTGKPLPLYDSEEKKSGNSRVSNPDYLAVYFVPDDDTLDDTLDKSNSSFHAATTRQRV